MIQLIVFILLLALASSLVLLRRAHQKSKAPISAKESAKESKKESTKMSTKASVKEKKRPKKIIPPPFEGAEKAAYLGGALPSSFTVSKASGNILVALRNGKVLIIKPEFFSNPVGSNKKLVDISETMYDITTTSKSVITVNDRKKSILSFTEEMKQTKINIQNTYDYVANKVRCAPNKAYFLVLGDDTVIRVFKPTGDRVFAKNTSQFRNTEITISHDSSLFTASSYTSEIVFYGVKFDQKGGLTVKKTFSSSGHENSINSVEFSPVTMNYVTGSEDGTFIMWLAPERWEEGDIPREVTRGHSYNTQPIHFVRFSPDGRLLAVESGDSTIEIFSITDFTVIKRIDQSHNLPVTHMEWGADSKSIYVGSADSGYIYGYNA